MQTCCDAVLRFLWGWRFESFWCLLLGLGKGAFGSVSEPEHKGVIRASDDMTIPIRDAQMEESRV